MNSPPVLAPLTLLVALLLALAGCGEGPSGTEEPPAGVTGTVTLGPQCPVEQADQPCPDAPAADVVVVVAKRLPGEAYAAGETVASDTTDADGAFRIAVPPGEYVVTAQAGMSCELMDAVVVAHEYVEVDVPCDTGIRAPVLTTE
ncbi:carboxypeptidase-like regulatory domain-containing protein [Nocardioides dilutus]